MMKTKQDKRVNCNYEVKNDKLIITIDLKKDVKLSSSGKSYIVASTGGNISLVGEYKDIKLGLNAYIPKKAYDEKKQAIQNLEATLKMSQQARENIQLKSEVDELKKMVKDLLKASKK